MFDCAESLSLGRHFSRCGERGLLFSCVAGAPHCGGAFCCGLLALKCLSLLFAGLGLSHCSTQALFGLFELSCLVVYEILVPQQPVSPALEGQFLTTRISG